MILIIVITAIITILSYNSIAFVIIALTDDEEVTIKVACGIIYPISYIITYPIRAWEKYSRGINYYKEHGITRFQYVFLFKRVHETKENK